MIPALDAANGCVPVGDIVCESYDQVTYNPSTPPNVTLTIRSVPKAEVEAQKYKFDQAKRDGAR